jgi:hypothetical protein
LRRKSLSCRVRPAMVTAFGSELVRQAACALAPETPNRSLLSSVDTLAVHHATARVCDNRGMTADPPVLADKAAPTIGFVSLG